MDNNVYPPLTEAESAEGETVESKQIDRVRIFWKTLVELTTSGRCHQGVRHELVGPLNRVYPGACFIESFHDELNVAILKILSEQLTQSSPSDKFKIFCAWGSGESQNPSLVGFFTNCQKIVVAQLVPFYHNQHGFNPTDIEKTIKGLMRPEYFPPPINIHPHAKLIHTILIAPIQRDLAEPRDQALMKAQMYLQHSDSLTFDSIQPTILNLSKVEQTWQAYHPNEIKYMVGDNEEAQSIRTTLLKLCDDYFKSFASSTLDLEKELQEQLEAIEKQQQQLDSCIDASKQNKEFFINFFIIWASLDPRTTNDQRASRYLQLRSLKDNIILPDVLVQQLLTQYQPMSSSSASTNIIETTPYLVARVMLHALLVSPANWSHDFYDLFSQYLSFVEGNFNLHADDPRYRGYLGYQQFVPELKFLKILYLRFHDHSPAVNIDHPFPANLTLPLLPNLEGLQGSEVCGDYSSSVLIINQISQMSGEELENLIPKISNFLSEHIFFDVLTGLNSAKRLNFLTLLESNYLKTIIGTGVDLEWVLNLLPEASRITFLESLDKQWLEQKIKSVVWLQQILQQLSEADRQTLLTLLGPNYLKTIIETGADLKWVLNLLPEASRITFLESLDKQWLEQKIENVFQLKQILQQLSESDQQTFLMLLEPNYLKKIIETNDDLVWILKLLSVANWKTFLESLDKQWLEQKIENVYLLKQILYSFNEYDRTTFLLSLEPNYLKTIIKNAEELPLILQVFPKAHWKTFLEKLGEEWLEQKIENIYQLERILYLFNEHDRKTFLMRLEPNYLKTVIKNANDLVRILNRLSVVNWKTFLEKLDKEWLEQKIEKADSLIQILERLPKAGRRTLLETFSKEYLSRMTKDEKKLIEILQQLPEADRRPFLLFLNLNDNDTINIESTMRSVYALDKSSREMNPPSKGPIDLGRRVVCFFQNLTETGASGQDSIPLSQLVRSESYYRM